MSNNEKKCIFFKNNAKIRNLKILKNIPFHLKTILTYHQTLEVVRCQLSLEKPKKDKFSKNLKRIASFIKKLPKVVILKI